MMGADALEGAQIVSIQEHIAEMKTAFRGLVPYGQEPDPALVSQWFNEGATDKSPANADMGARKTRFFKWFTGRIEAVVGGGRSRTCLSTMRSAKRSKRRRPRRICRPGSV